MIYSYEYSAMGSSHKKVVDGECQDAKKMLTLDSGVVIAAVADGVGSCKHSAVAAKIAVDTSVRVCTDEISKDSSCNLVDVIEKAFVQAERAIDEHSFREKHLVTEYDTTLDLVIYDGKHIAYGHCGDGGIIGLTPDGDYVKVTVPKKTEGVYVVPLRGGKDTWVIEKSSEEFASVLLATDGVYNIFFPALLVGQPVDMYIPLLRYFMDNNVLNATEQTIDGIEKERKDFLDGEDCVSITDDKTFIVLINGKIQPKEKETSYYAEPDWDALQIEWNKKLYPQYKKNDTSYVGDEAEFSSKEAKNTANDDEELTKK